MGVTGHLAQELAVTDSPEEEKCAKCGALIGEDGAYRNVRVTKDDEALELSWAPLCPVCLAEYDATEQSS
jgi:hypothetical protein